MDFTGIGLPITRILALGLIGLIFRYLVKWFINPKSLPLPPGPKPLPLIGNIHQLPKSLQWLHLHRMSKTYGPVMYFNMAGQPLIVLSTHEAAHELLSRRGARYSDRPRMVMANELVTKGLHLLFRQYDDRYKLHQRMHAPLLNLQASSTYRPLQDMESRQLLLDVMLEGDRCGEKGIDFHHHHERAMASTIYSLMYGYRLKTGHEKELLDAKKVVAEFTRTGQVGAYIVDSFPWLNYLPRLLAPWKREAEKLWHLERNLHVENLKRGLGSRGWTFVKHMANSTEALDLSVDEIAFDAGILTDAALDTSTVALDWFIVARITTGAAWVPKAQKLLDQVVGHDRLPTFEDRPRLAYIDAIVNETLRWRPGVPGGVPHVNRTEDEYQGYRIPAKSIILPNHFAITRDEAVFGPDVDSFIPERWMADDADEKSPQPDACGFNTAAIRDLPYVGFGYGRRGCTGRYVARNQLWIQIARMLWAFDVEPGVDEETGEGYVVDDMDFTEGFATMPKPFKAVMRPRGAWARLVILQSGSTHEIDHAELLNRARGGGKEHGLKGDVCTFDLVSET